MWDGTGGEVQKGEGCSMPAAISDRSVWNREKKGLGGNFLVFFYQSRNKIEGDFLWIGLAWKSKEEKKLMLCYIKVVYSEIDKVIGMTSFMLCWIKKFAKKMEI